MKQIYTFAFLLFISMAGFGQNWSVLGQNEDTLHFIGSNGAVLSLRTDSSITVGNKHFIFPQKELELSDAFAPCYASRNGNSWLGDTIAEFNDSITFYYHAKKLTWSPLDSVSEMSFGASYISIIKTSKSWQSLNNGMMDTVLTFNVSDSVNGALANCLNGKQIKISKHNGLISFPSCFKRYAIYQINSIQPVQAQIGQLTRIQFQLPTVLEIFDFEVGDEFHYTANSDHNYNGLSTTKIIKTVTNKTINTQTNSVEYTFQRQFETEKSGNIIASGSNILIENYSNVDASLVSTFSGETYLNNTNNHVVQHVNFIKNGSRSFDKIDAWKYGMYVPGPNTSHCLGQFWRTPDGYVYDAYAYKNCVEGLGIVAEVATTYQIEIVTTSLIYYKKGSVTWGNPHAIAIDENTLNAITIFPNPTSDFLRLSGLEVESVFWQITDLSGRELKQGFTNEENTEIDVRNLGVGVYFLLLENQKAVKFIKE